MDLCGVIPIPSLSDIVTHIFMKKMEWVCRYVWICKTHDTPHITQCVVNWQLADTIASKICQIAEAECEGFHGIGGVPG